jgi:Fe-S-cluster-containing dehydrogenase component/DMSO reductase anchor subunit
LQLLDLPTIGQIPGPPLIDAFLAQQQALTVVERFARQHETGDFDRPIHQRRYQELIPLARPQPGQQYAFSVDLDACSGCKACVTACHSLNGLDDCETFRDVGALTGRDSHGLHVLQHVTTACHHCLEPACLLGCPTQAYDKDPVTGIVRHLDDQCIGCQYCTLMCPYDVPKYNPAKGIVRKCDMCRQRLVDDEAPACVQACPNQAIRIELIRTSDVMHRAAVSQFLEHAPDPRLTLPTTRFVSKRTLRDVEPVNDHDRPAHWHLPLVFMLVLTQMSVGMFFVAAGLLLAGIPSSTVAIAAAVFGVVGLAVANLHLGRPQIAYRAWLGWRTSWMSREIIAFGAFMGLAAATAWFAKSSVSNTQYLVLTTAATCLTGAIALLCSAMIYVATRRDFWTAGRTISHFVITAALLGPAAALAIIAACGAPIHPTLTSIVVGAALARLLSDTRLYDISRSAELLTGPLSSWNSSQAIAAIVGGLILPLMMLEMPPLASALAIPMALLLTVAELIHRGLFFAAAVAPRMPGVHQT